MEVIPKDMLDRVAATFSAYLLISDYSKQYRDEIMTEFERYVKWISLAPGEGQGATILNFENRAGRGPERPKSREYG